MQYQDNTSCLAYQDRINVFVQMGLPNLFVSYPQQSEGTMLDTHRHTLKPPSVLGR